MPIPRKMSIREQRYPHSLARGTSFQGTVHLFGNVSRLYHFQLVVSIQTWSQRAQELRAVKESQFSADTCLSALKVGLS